MECKFNKDEFCTNDECPMCADYCPVPDYAGVCKYEEREEERYKLSPKGCLIAALAHQNIYIDDVIDEIWEDFSSLMVKLGYAEEGD